MSETYTKAQFWKCALQVNPASYLAYRGQEQNLTEEEYNQQQLKFHLPLLGQLELLTMKQCNQHLH